MAQPSSLGFYDLLLPFVFSLEAKPLIQPEAAVISLSKVWYDFD